MNVKEWLLDFPVISWKCLKNCFFFCICCLYRQSLCAMVLNSGRAQKNKLNIAASTLRQTLDKNAATPSFMLTPWSGCYSELFICWLTWPKVTINCVNHVFTYLFGWVGARRGPSRSIVNRNFVPARDRVHGSVKNGRDAISVRSWKHASVNTFIYYKN